jgi:hypothetical protein
VGTKIPRGGREGIMIRKGKNELSIYYSTNVLVLKGVFYHISHPKIGKPEIWHRSTPKESHSVLQSIITIMLNEIVNKISVKTKHGRVYV